MPHDRHWVTDTLRHLGYPEVAEKAARELPDPATMDQIAAFADRHGISRDELTSRMGGSP
jgi:hypothetical protein